MKCAYQSNTYGWVSISVRKDPDKRITIGWAIHWFPDCRHLRRCNRVEMISGALAVKMPTCGECNSRLKRGIKQPHPYAAR